MPDPSLLRDRLHSARRRAVGASLTILPPDAACAVPRLAAPVAGELALESAVAERAAIGRALRQHGALLCSGFAPADAAALRRFARGLCGRLVEYSERTSPRKELDDHVYTVTEYPAHQGIGLHNENAYAAQWPGTMFFWCVRPAASGGQTLLADTRRVLAGISQATRRQFAQKRVRYRRELGPPLGLPWPYVFQCERREQVDQQCAAHGYAIQWHDDERASLSRVAEAIVAHPVTGEACWFNHALFFHETSLAAELREGIRALYGDQYLPYRTAFGDGSEIDAAMLAEIAAAYAAASFELALQENEVLIVDNLLMAHGRRPYAGPRDIRLVMADTLDAG